MMISILMKLLIVTSIGLAVYSLYFLAVALLGLRKGRAAVPASAPQTRFALVVAARNEANVIGHLVDSLAAQKYPKELFSIIVAPNNCTDDTSAIAAAHGARIFTPEGIIKSKGAVLTQVVDAVVIGEQFDAMCVFDADNLVDEYFLTYMNNAIVNGASIVQGFRDSKNPKQSAISGCYSICYWMLNRFYNTARVALHLSALVNGSGFAVTRGVLERLDGWHTCTMTEDYEFSAQCALLGERIHFSEEARVYDEQPLTFAESWKQRRRWTTGSLQGLRQYGHRLFAKVVLERNAVCFDMYLTFLTPFVQLLSVITAIGGIALALGSGGILLHGILIHGLVIAIATTFVGFFACVLGSMILAAVTVSLQHTPICGMGKSIATYWLFLISHTALTLLSFVYPKTTWDPIAHTAAKSLAQMKHQN
ncbi:MAG: glycosyltransferase family 2 protein [Ruthenibacterium sp.]